MQKEHNPKAPRGQDSGNLQAALDLAAKDIPVLPWRWMERKAKWDKVPHITDWPNKATTDARQIKRWFAKWPDAQVGFVTGERSGIDVVDLDRKHGKDGVAACEVAGIKVDSPVVIETSTGGLHHWCAHVPGQCSAQDLLDGVDVRANGGWAAAPGSDGYRFVSGDSDLWDDLQSFGCAPQWPEGLEPQTRPEGSAFEPVGVPFEVLSAAVLSIPNKVREQLYGSEGAWFAAIRALHDETSGSEEGRELAHKFSEGWGGYSFEETEDKWNRPNTHTGAKASVMGLIRVAQRNGWCSEAFEAWQIADDFDDLPMPEEEAKPFFMDMADMLADEAPPREWHVADWIPAKTVHMLAGDGGSGKSLLGIQLAVATGTGGEWLGHDVTKPGVALYYGAEDDRDELHRRFADVCRGLEVDPTKHRGRVLLRSAVAEDTVFATVAKDGKVQATPVLKRMEREIAAAKPSLVVLDTLANLHALDPNSQEQAKAFVGLLIGMAQRHGCTFVLLAHPSRSGMATGDGDGFSVGWSNAVRSRSYLAADKDNPEINVLSIKKANYGKRGLEMKMQWEAGVFVKVSNEYVDASRAKYVFIEILERMASQHTYFSNNPGTNYAPSRFAEEPEAAGISKAQFARAMREMIKDDILKIEEYQTAQRKTGKRIARGEYDLESDFDFGEDSHA